MSQQPGMNLVAVSRSPSVCGILDASQASQQQPSNVNLSSVCGSLGVSRSPSLCGILDASQVNVITLNSHDVYEKMPSVPAYEQMPSIPEEPRSPSGAFASDVKELWKFVKDLQKSQEDMSISFHRNLEVRFNSMENDIADIRQKVFSEQDLRVTDALDYAEAEVQDLRASLEKVQERQDTDASKLQRQQVILFEQFKQLQALQTSHAKQLQQCSEVCSPAGACKGPISEIYSLRQKLVNESEVCAVTPQDLGSLRTQVEQLETKWVAEQARMARQESEHERVVLTLESRIDSWEVHHKSSSTMSTISTMSTCSKDPLEDLQAVVKRQLVEEHGDVLQDLKSVVNRQLLDDGCGGSMTDIHNLRAKQYLRCAQGMQALVSSH